MSLQTGPEVTNLFFEQPATRTALPSLPDVPREVGATDAMLPSGVARGRNTIIVDEWGPYDYKAPKLWPAGKLTDRPLKLLVLGPIGKWTVTSVKGGSVSTRSGEVPGDITVTPTGKGLDFELQLAYVGGEVVTSRGEKFAAGASVPFRFSLLEPADWSVSWWTFDPTNDPLSAPDAFTARLRTDPLKSEVLPRLDWATSGVLSPGVPADRVAMRAETTVSVPAGGYDLYITSDDGVRVFVDGVMTAERWSVHETQADRITLSPGTRKIRIDYFDAAGWAELQVKFVRRPQ